MCRNMKKLFQFIPAIIILAVSCGKEVALPTLEENDPASQVEMVTETISGARGVSTKALISDSDASFSWTDGDNVALHITKGEYVYTSDKGALGATTDENDSKIATFTVVYEAGYSRDAFAVYPSTLVAKNAKNYGQKDNPLDLTLPGSYTLAQVAGETSPCPMISTDVAGDNWDFYQLCGLMRLTVNNIPAAAKRLEIDFNGKKVCGNFSIAYPIVPGTSVIETSADDASDVIAITKDGSDVVLGETSLVLNIPLPVPVNEVYSGITVYAYDAVSKGNLLSFSNMEAFSYSGNEIKAFKRAATLPNESTYTFTFKDKDTQNNLSGLRFVRIFSTKNKLYNGATTFGPYTVSSATGAADMDNPVEPTLRFAANEGDQLVFQVIDASGKVYSGLYDVPAGCSAAGDYNLTVDVKAYTFTLAADKKVYFSPGDLGVDGGVYSFTEPFASWNDSSKDQAPSKRTWFNWGEVNYTTTQGGSGHEIYGVKWRVTTGEKVGKNSFTYELDYLINRTIDEGRVATYYHIKIGSNYCLLLSPDEAVESDLDGLTDGATITDYQKYLGKGFVLLWNKGRRIDASKRSWGGSNQGWYWAVCENGTNRRYFYWTTSSKPKIDWGSSQYRMRARYVRDVE